MADKLSLFNGALRLVKERKLSSLAENREPRRLLDDAWGDGQTTGAVKYCLQMGEWTFATRTVQADASASVEPPFGYQFAFDQPEDMVRVCGIWEDPQCKVPLLDYSDERHFWYANLATIYVSYVSNADDYGADMSLWPETFVEVVEGRLAQQIVGNLTQGESKIKAVEDNWEAVKLTANSIDTRNKPTKFMPQGSWSAARQGYGTSYRNSRWDGRS